MKIIYTLVVLFVTTIASSQNCYQTNIDIGIQKYNENQYDIAITNFSNAKKCSDSKGNTMPNNWITKCKNKQQEIINKRNDKKAYQSAIQLATEESYKLYLSSFPNGKWNNEIAKKLKFIVDERDLTDFTNAKNLNTEEAYKKYILKYPTGNWKEEGETKINKILEKELLLFQEALNENTIVSYQAYLKTNPKTKYKVEIKENLATLTFSSTFGKNKNSWVNSMIQSFDGNFVLVGQVDIDDEKSMMEVICVNEVGNLIWRKQFEGAIGNSIIELKDGSFIILANNSSILKLNIKGSVIWKKNFGVVNDSIWMKSIVETKDGGFMVMGNTSLKGNGLDDIYILKLNKNGEKQWDKTYGGIDMDKFMSYDITNDDALIIAGNTRSIGSGAIDIWILKISIQGKVLWQKTYGGTEDDGINTIISSGNNFLVAGYTKSKTVGKSDMWILQLNKKGEKIWDKTYGFEGNYAATDIIQTNEGDFIVLGETPFKGIQILNVTKNGKIKSSRGVTRFGMFENSASIVKTNDGSFVIAANTINRNNIMWLFKVDKSGDILNLKENKLGYIYEEELKEYKEIITNNNWKERYSETTSLNNDFFKVELNKKYGVVNKGGKEIVPCIYNYIKPSYIDIGYIWVQTGDYYCLYTTSGELVITKEQKILDAYFQDVDGQELVRVTNGKWGWINKNTGKIVIPLIYEDVYTFNNGKCEVTVDKNLKKWFVINKKGECIKKCKNSNL